MRRNSICLVNPTVLIKRPISELAFVLKKRGWDVAVLTPRRERKHDGSSHHTDLLKGIPIYTYRTMRLPFTGFEWPIPISTELWKALRKIGKRYRVIQVWTHFYLSVLLTVSFFRKKPQKVVVSLDTLPGLSFSAGTVMNALFKLYTKTIGKWLLRQADVVHVYGDRLKTILEHLGVGHVKTISTGILERHKGKSKRATFDAKGRFVVSFIGLMNTRKGIDVLLRSATRMPDCVFLVAGDGPDRKRYECKAPKNVRFLGQRKDVQDILASSDVFFLPSRGEGLPGVIFEAMQAGLPVVASDIACIDEQVTREEGVLCPMDDVDCFVKALCKLRDDSGRRKRMGKSARKRIRRFSWDKLISKYEELYA